MIRLHWTSILAIVLAAISCLFAASFFKGSSNDYGMGGIIGCGFLLLGAVVVLVVLLVRAWGWL